MFSTTAIRALLMAVALSLPLSGYTPAVPIFSPPSKEADPLYDSATWHKLQGLLVTVKWEHIPLKAALEDLTLRVKQANASHLEIRFWTDVSNESKQVGIEIGPEPVEDVLGYICMQCNLHIRIHKSEVELYASRR